MCGITGFFSPDKEINTTKYYDAHLLISHRGPDDEGFLALAGGEPAAFKGDDTIDYYRNLEHVRQVQKSKLMLGHRRLSIIDLTHQGHQPFSDEDNNFFLVFNGEIFNYLELRHELKQLGYQFSTDSDTEVLLKSYIHWGLEAFNKFNGMWAIALFDKREDSLILSRDRFGIKPLYYSLINGVVYFSSEIKFINAILDDKLSLNEESVKAYLDRCLLNYSPDTFWREVKELEPAHCLIVKNKTVTIKKYWDFHPDLVNFNETQALEKFAYLFEDSLKLRMRSDVEVGTLLSGGMDSALIVCTLSKLGFIKEQNFKSFSGVFEDKRFSEKEYIDEILKTTDLDPYFIYPKPEELGHHLERLLYHIEEPFRSLSVYSQFLIYQRVKSDTNVKVVLNGQGGDELFGGYSYHYYLLFGELLKKFCFKQLFYELKLFKEFRNVDNRSLLINLLKHYIKSLAHRNYFNSVTFNELKVTALREYLKYDDRNSMAFGIEARVPFLDYRLVEFAFILDEKFKINNFVNKKIERQYSKGVVPDSVIQRKDKMGFVSPQEVWQRTELRDLLTEAYSFLSIHPEYIFINDKKEVLKNFQEYLGGKNDNWPFVWRIFCLLQWLRVHKLC